jgi:hypothetical protein
MAPSGCSKIGHGPSRFSALHRWVTPAEVAEQTQVISRQCRTSRSLFPAIERWRRCPKWPRHNGPIFTATNIQFTGIKSPGWWEK